MLTKKTCEGFVEALSSKEPVPGGGGASALVAAIGTALGNMVASLTIGKAKYENVEKEMAELQGRARALQEELLSLVDADAECFLPLAQAYRMPKDTPEQLEEKTRVMEAALEGACQVPLSIMEACCHSIELMQAFADKGAAIALSDAGCGAILCKGALQAASLNVLINTKSMTDREKAEKYNTRCQQLLDEYTCRADAIFFAVQRRLV